MHACRLINTTLVLLGEETDCYLNKNQGMYPVFPRARRHFVVTHVKAYYLHLT